MALSLLLAEKIISMALMALFGFVLVRAGLMKSEDKAPLNVLVLYAISPCVVISAFQVELNQEHLFGLGVAALGAVAVHVLYIPLAALLGRTCSLSRVEQASLVYSNAGNLILPLVSSVLGQEYVFYACAYVAVQACLVWSHGVLLLAGKDAQISWKSVLLNPNILSVFLALILFFGRIMLPDILCSTITSVGDTIGPLSMIITGMILASIDFRQVFSRLRVYLVSAGRLIFFPLLLILLIRLTGVTLQNETVRTTLLITLLAACAPAASNVTLISLLYNGDSDGASSINVMSLLLCILTMPLMVLVYQILC